MTVQLFSFSIEIKVKRSREGVDFKQLLNESRKSKHIDEFATRQLFTHRL